MQIHFGQEVLFEYKEEQNKNIYLKVKNAFLEEERVFIFFSTIKFTNKSKIYKPVDYRDGKYMFLISFNNYGMWIVETYEKETLKTIKEIEVI